ncbi:methyltransferase domain-containing protein [Crossiella sp. SN42]|uniref:SAM-dependent methyltransferase n=1 Tax=Crossiella sp. SN42 TaxID=2944808 RepID=UPI00207CCEB4|nr:class I SAM-dependent methyltransferase [Crossiella sp. SN42]MCO1575659.1 methyltransferase domain-containing protein [Crossiella sp. SN42]
MTIRGHRDVTAEAVGAYYDQITEFIDGDLGGSFHVGYWAGLPYGTPVQEAAQRMTALMIDKLAVRPGQRVLDVGCGTGRPALELARSTGAEVVGVNVSRRQLDLAERNAAEAGLTERVRFEFADATDLPYPAESFDGVWLFESLFHMPDQAKVLRQLAEVLRPGGRLVIADLVQLVPLTEEQNQELRETWALNSIAAIHPLVSYPALLAESGLELVESLDITEDSLRGTFRGLQAEHDAYVAANGELPEEADAGVDNGWAKLAVTPEIGYAVVVAGKPSPTVGG